VFALSALVSGITCAQDKDALRRAQQQMQKLQQANTALEREKQELMKKLADAEERAKAIDQLKSDLSSARREAARHSTEAGAERDKAAVEAARFKGELATAARSADSQRREAERLRTQISEGELQLATLRKTLAERDSSLATCTTKNQSMLRTGREILERLSNGTCAPSDAFVWDPMFQLSRVRFEIEIERYLDRLYDDRYLGPP
jgi:chromosome segregation ATPase